MTNLKALLNIAFVSFGIFICSSCQKSEETKALEFLKENREIRNGYDGNDSLTKKVISVFHAQNFKKTPKCRIIGDILLDSLLKRYPSTAKLVSDKVLVSDSYLIKHRDWAIKTWKNEWCNHLSYNDFCNLILPYRLTTEPHEDWVTALTTKYPWILRIDKKKTSIFDAVCQINDSLLKYQDYLQNFDKLRMLNATEMLDASMGQCRNRAILATLMMRAAGLPVGLVCNREGHYWNIFVDKNNQWISFQGCETNPVKGKPLGEIRGIKKSKVYLCTLQPAEHELYLSDKEFANSIPKGYPRHFWIDVTAKVIPVTDIDIPVINKNNSNNKFPVFLCANTNRNIKWVPVDYCKGSENDTMHFNNVGKGTVYILANFIKNEFTSISHPFLVDSNGKVRYFIADDSNLNSITMFRKTDLYDKGYKFAKEQIGATITASNSLSFKHFELIHTIDTIYDHYDGDSFATKNKFRYFKFYSAQLNNGIAEFDLIDNNGNSIIKKISCIHKKQVELDKLNDKDYSSYCELKKVKFFIIDAEKKVLAKSFRILARNDLNVIENGEPYTLFTWKNGCWKLVGESIGVMDRVTFSNLPSNALYYLSHKTKGNESTLFWINNNKYYWTITDDYYK